MQELKHYRALIFVLAGACISALAGCSGNGTPSPGSTGPAPDVNGASVSAASDVTASVGSMTMLQSSAAGGAMADTVRQGGVQADTASAGKCGVVVVNSTGTSGQVTDETITYALPACEFTGVRGLDSLAITGALELTMPDATGYNFTARPTALEYAFTASGVTSSETRTGTRQVAASASSASMVNDITTQFVKAGTSTGTFISTLTLSFTPASGSTLAKGKPLPDGTFEVNGNVSWTPTTAGATAEGFTVSTIAPLSYDTSCASTSASPFDAGQLRVVVTDGSVKTYAQITWSECGAPSVVVI